MGSSAWGWPPRATPARSSATRRRATSALGCGSARCCPVPTPHWPRLASRIGSRRPSLDSLVRPTSLEQRSRSNPGSLALGGSLYAVGGIRRSVHRRSARLIERQTHRDRPRPHLARAGRRTPAPSCLATLNARSSAMRTTSNGKPDPSSLEPTTQRFIDGLAGLPPLSTLTPDAAHKLLTDLQAKPVAMRPAEIEDTT